jgi:hypothetical protein
MSAYSSIVRQSSRRWSESSGRTIASVTKPVRKASVIASAKSREIGVVRVRAKMVRESGPRPAITRSAS